MPSSPARDVHVWGLPRPYFVSRDLMVRQLEHLMAQGTTVWQQRLRRPMAAVPMQDFLGDSTRRRRLGGPRSSRTSKHHMLLGVLLRGR